MTSIDQNAARPAKPVLNPVSAENIRASLAEGIADFRAAPIHGMFFGLIFSLIGILIAFILVVSASSTWVLPLAAGFPLIGPFAAIGLYEVSRRLDSGEPLDWQAILGAVGRSGRTQLPSYAFVVLFIYMIWVYLAHLIFALSFGISALTNVSSSFSLLLTAPGLTMLFFGTVIGGAIALLLYAISVISVPMMVDRDIDIVTAMIASVKCVISNRAMLGWALVIACTIAAAMIPLFLGMIVVFPILGHASWHLYRKAVA